MPRFGPQLRDRPVLAVGTTAYHGEPVAAVAAETRDAAEEAAALVARGARGAAGRDAPSRPPSTRRRRWSRTRRSGPATRSPSTNVLREHALRLGRPRGRRARGRRSSSRAPTPSRWSPSSRSSRTPSSPRPTATASPIWSSIQHPYWLQRVDRHAARACRWPRSACSRPTRAAGSAASSTRSTSRCSRSWPARAGRPVRLVLTPRGDVPGRPPGRVRDPRPVGVPCRRHAAFRDIEANYLVGAYADIADRVVGKGSYTVERAVPGPRPSRIVARSLLSHTVPSTAFRGFGNPQQIWAVESNMDEAALRLGIDPLELRLRNLAHRGDPFIPGDLRGGRRVVRDRAAAADRASAGDRRCRRAAAAGIAVGPQGGPDDRPLLLDRPAAGRRQRRRQRRAPRTWARARARSSRRSPPRSSARPSNGSRWSAATRPIVPVRPADVGQPVVGADGQRRAARAAATSRRSSRRWPRGWRGSTSDEVAVDRGRGADRRPGAGRSATCSIRGLGRLGGEVIGVGEMRKEAEPEHPLGGTAAFYEFNCTAVEVSVDRGDRRRDGGAARDGVGRRARRCTRARSAARTRAPRSWAWGTR